MENFGKRTDLLPDLEKGTPQHVHVELAKKAGIGKSSMAYLLAVYRNRPDLFELVFNGGLPPPKRIEHEAGCQQGLYRVR